MRNLAPGELGGNNNKSAAEGNLDFMKSFTGFQEDLSINEQIIAANLFNKKATEAFQVSSKFIHESRDAVFNTDTVDRGLTVIAVQKFYDESWLYYFIESFPDYEKHEDQSPVAFTIFERLPGDILGAAHQYSVNKDFDCVSRLDQYDVLDRFNTVNNIRNFVAENNTDSIGYEEERLRYELMEIVDQNEEDKKLNNQPVNVYEVDEAFHMFLWAVSDGGLVSKEQLALSRMTSLDTEGFF